jgi:16S rRNA (cytosine967-C5)-methyltransferase
MIQRLHDVPWPALDGLASTLEPALSRILTGAAADAELDRLLRAHRGFSADQRRVCAEALFGVGLWRRRLRAHLDETAPPIQLLACLARDLGGCPEAPRLLATELQAPRPITDWRDRTSIPDWLASALESAVGDEAPALAAAINSPGPISIRVNRAKTTRDDLCASLEREARPTTAGHWSDDALHLTTRPANLTATQAWRDGLFEIQDEGSQLLAAIVPSTGSALDLCAGAGGKTLALASRTPGRALHATDVELARLDRLRTRAARAGATVSIHGAAPPADLRVQHVLIDAPCSELGSLRRGPDLRWRLDPSSFSSWPTIQRALLDLGARHLLPGGTITYATCTLRPEENEHVVAAFLESHPEFSRERPALSDALLDAEGALRLFPHRHGTDGFFGVLLRHRP